MCYWRLPIADCRFEEKAERKTFSACSIDNRQSQIGNALLVLIYINVLGIDDVVVSRITGRRRTRRRSLFTSTAFSSRWGRLLIQRLRQFM
jgi:hypothetical protein